MESIQGTDEELRESRLAPAGPPRCDCQHEELTDGYHHYLDLPGQEAEEGMTHLDDGLQHKEGYYIAVAIAYATPCFMRPSWRATFSGHSEAGEIPTSARLLCGWCRTHWSNSPSVDFHRIS